MDILALLQNEAVQAVLVLLGLKLIPNAYLAKFFHGIGRTLSAGGNKYVGRVWEEVVEDTIGVCLENLLKGLKSDDK